MGEEAGVEERREITYINNAKTRRKDLASLRRGGKRGKEFNDRRKLHIITYKGIQ